jgi:hypothetical protein
MTANKRNWQLRCLIAMAAVLLLTTMASAAQGRTRRAKIGEFNSADQTVEMFNAIEKGDIAVKLIPKDSSLCRVRIENKTDKPLNVKLPESFVGVPVLAQAGIGGGGIGGGGAGIGGGGGRSSTSSSGTQSMGGGMGGMGMGGMGMGGGMFNVPPEKVGQFEVPTVCLEHGKKEPNARVPYEIRPLESFTAKPGVRELCELLGNNKINQRAAQAAAWHLCCDMSWDALAKESIRHINAPSEPYFSRDEILAGMKIVATAVRLAEENKQKTGASTSQSASEK